MPSLLIDSAEFSSLVVSFVGNTIPTILNKPISAVYEDERLCRVELMLLIEAFKIGEELGLGLAPSNERSCEFLSALQRKANNFKRWSRVALGRLPLVSYQAWITREIASRYGEWAPLLDRRHSGTTTCDNPHRRLLGALPADLSWQPRLHVKMAALLDHVFQESDIRMLYHGNVDLFVDKLLGRQFRLPTPGH